MLSVAGLGVFLYGDHRGPRPRLGRGRTLGRPPSAPSLLVAFGRWELRTAEPMLDLRYFRDPRFAAATSSITLVFFVMFGTFFLITQYFQEVRGYGPLSAACLGRDRAACTRSARPSACGS